MATVSGSFGGRGGSVSREEGRAPQGSASNGVRTRVSDETVVYEQEGS